VADTKKDLLDPAIIGTTSKLLSSNWELYTDLSANWCRGILKSIKSALTVKRVVIPSSFDYILDGPKGARIPHKTHSEADWNPITEEEALKNPINGYRGIHPLFWELWWELIEVASKTFAEKAAWEVEKNEKPNFTIATICPPLVLGPIVHYLDSLDSLNTSNQRVRNLITGQCKEEIPDTGTYIRVDVRDLALAHVKAMELPDAADKRFFVTAGYFSNKEICEIIRKHFPEYKDELPKPEIKCGDYPEGGVYKYDNSRVMKVLGLKFRTLEESIVDTVKSLQAVGA